MRFPRLATFLFALLALLTLIPGSAFAQQRSEKAAEATAESQPKAQKSPAKEKEEKKEEEKGMRYRMIGPYRGGRFQIGRAHV